MTRPLSVIGVPTSAGAFAPGQEQAPAALREAGLVELLQQSGIRVHDRGDRPVWRWRPDRADPRAQNRAAVVEIVRETAARVADAANEATLVLGGDCTVGIGTVAGHAAAGERVGLVYLDTHADLNVPASVREGTLDWMGLAHMLGEDEAVPELARVGSRYPLLDPERVVLLAWGVDQATDFERAAVARHGLGVIPVDEVADAPDRAAARALKLLEARCDRLLVHFDVDVIDFTDVPLSENPGRNEGISFDDAATALRTLVASPLLAGLTITELNPAHAEDARAIERFASAVVDALAGAPALERV